MKNNFRKLPFLGLIALLSACNGKAYDVSLLDYTRDPLQFSGDEFTICVFNDVHLGLASRVYEEFEYYQKALYSNGKKPDLLVLNGDTFHSANKTIVKMFFDWLESEEVPYAYVYGNHDLQGKYSNNYINSFLVKQDSHSMVCNPKDNVYGDSNYFINITNGNELKWQLYFFDSNTYHGFAYDVIHEDQINWYKSEVEATTAKEGKTIPSLAFFHIPFEEFVDAWDQYGDAKYTTDDAENNDNWWMTDTGIGNGFAESEIYETMKELGSTKGVVVAHDHTNNCDFNYGGIRLIYATKTGRGIYHDSKMMGACFATLKDDGSFTLKRMNVPYVGEPFEYTNENPEKGGNN